MFELVTNIEAYHNLHRFFVRLLFSSSYFSIFFVKICPSSAISTEESVYSSPHLHYCFHFLHHEQGLVVYTRSVQPVKTYFGIEHLDQLLDPKYVLHPQIVDHLQLFPALL
ncbi:hypothetical protein Bca4012_092330 [Brassica carinata]